MEWLSEVGHCQSGHLVLWPVTSHTSTSASVWGWGSILDECQNHLLPVDSQATVFPGIRPFETAAYTNIASFHF